MIQIDQQVVGILVELLWYWIYLKIKQYESNDDFNHLVFSNNVSHYGIIKDGIAAKLWLDEIRTLQKMLPFLKVTLE